MESQHIFVGGGCLRGVLVNGCGIVVSEFELPSWGITFTFGQIPLGKV